MSETFRQRSCLRKRPYLSQIGALVSAVRYTAKGAPKLRAYRCPCCGFYHLTKKPSTGGGG